MVKTTDLVAAMRCSSQAPTSSPPCTTCAYRAVELLDGREYTGCDCDRMGLDAADRLEELVDRCARYAEEIAVLRERGKRAVEDASPYAAATERRDVGGGGVPDAPDGTEKMLGEGTMSDRELLDSLKRLKVQTGSIACVGCGYEHNCGIHGCAILREMIAWLERTLAEGRPSSVMDYRDEH